MITLEKLVEAIRKKIGSRQSAHGESWRLMSLDSLFFAAIYKLERARTDVMQGKRGKAQLDDLIDAAAYIYFLVNRLSKR